MYQDQCILEARKCSAKPPPGSPHGVAVPGSEKPGRTAAYRHWRVGTGPLLSTIDPEITTMHEAFEAACRKWPDNKCLGWREQDRATGAWGPYKWIDYKTVQKRRAALGAGLVQLHQEAGVTQSQYAVGLWAQNRPEWQITDLACMSQNLYSVSIYDTLGPSTAEYIINHAELVCVVSSIQHVPTLLSIKERTPTLKIIISMDPLQEPGEPEKDSKKALLSAWAAEKGVQLYSMAEVEAMGIKHPRPYSPPRPHDPITINYTSGTTGNPKGVLLTHGNCIAGASAAMTSVMSAGPEDVLLSYLPLAHIYARVAENTALWGGSALGYFHGNIQEVLDDIKQLRPTGFISVPRLYNRIAAGIKAATTEQPGFKGALSRHVVSTKLANIKETGSNKHAIYDRIWGAKVKAAIGFDRCRGMVCGSAPIAPEVIQFLRVVLGNNFIEGFGMTETYACAMGQLEGDHTAGNVGPPIMSCECSLRDVPDMGYTVNDKPYPRGELLVRGNCIFGGYYKAPEVNAESFTEDGWFATGDICHVDELGRFKVVDRVKNLLKLAQGEYVSPEKIENQYLAQMPILAQCFVHGDSFQTYVVGVFGVDKNHFAGFASGVLGKKIDPEDEQQVLAACANPKVRKAVLKQMDSVAKRSNMAGFERVRNVHLCVEPFTIENDLLTPTLKLKRPPTVKLYKEILDKLYEETNAEMAAAGGEKARL